MSKLYHCWVIVTETRENCGHDVFARLLFNKTHVEDINMVLTISSQLALWTINMAYRHPSKPTDAFEVDRHEGTHRYTVLTTGSCPQKQCHALQEEALVNPAAERYYLAGVMMV